MSALKNLNTQFVLNIKTHKLLTDAKRNLILLILKSTTTKREARNYLEKYRSQFDFLYLGSFEQQALDSKETQRDLFVNRYLAKKNPFLSIYRDDKRVEKVPLRLAIFKICLSTILPQTWAGIAETFQRLVHLGITPIIVLDYGSTFLVTSTFKTTELFTIEHGNRIMSYLSGPKLGVSSSTNVESSSSLTASSLGRSMLETLVLRSIFTIKNKKLKINSLEELLIPLYQGIIPIIQPIVYNADLTYQEIFSADELLYSLVELLVGSNTPKELLSIEKIVFVDPIGGIPLIERNQTSHVFINLSQEYSDLVSELFIGFIPPKTRDLHLRNLNSMDKILQKISKEIGNDDATGIITTPYIMLINNDELNPIVYNVLTDRPVISLSLPLALRRTPLLSTLIIKKGMEVKVLDAENYFGQGEFTFENLVKEGIIDKNKLIGLINDSFGKNLNEEAYIKRINNLIALIIIIGDYDGGAIITYEDIAKSEGSRAKAKVAYLDKFAIAKRNQGLPGLADVVFKAVLQASPYEMIWRSRKNNPVNKWYFERSVGSISAPSSKWKIFYTGEVFNRKIDRSRGRVSTPQRIDIDQKLAEYLAICESIVPSFLE